MKSTFLGSFFQEKILLKLQINSNISDQFFSSWLEVVTEANTKYLAQPFLPN